MTISDEALKRLKEIRAELKLVCKEAYANYIEASSNLARARQAHSEADRKIAMEERLTVIPLQITKKKNAKAKPTIISIHDLTSKQAQNILDSVVNSLNEREDD